MALSVYDINTALKADSSLANIAGKTMNFFPVVATNGETAPFVIYYYQPSIPSSEAYWMRWLVLTSASSGKTKLSKLKKSLKKVSKMLDTY